MPLQVASGGVAAGPLDASFFERLFQGSGIAVFACDTRGRVRAWNALGESLLRSRGCWRDGATIEEALPQTDRQLFHETLRTCLTTRAPLEMRTSLASPEGEVTDYALWLTPIESEGGGLDGVAVWFHDITARVNLRRNRRRRERLNSLGAMSGAVAHHYSNLLCSIATSIEYACNMSTLSAAKRALVRTADAVRRATQLTRQLLAFAQADHSSSDQSDLTEVVLYVCDDWEPRLTPLGIEMDVEWKAGPAFAVPRAHMMMVLNNLLENAREAQASGGRIWVVITREHDAMRVSVRDAGPGIRPEQFEHLFEPFYSTKGELCGGAARHAGMGLAVAYGLVSEMGGTITASNVPNAGARFDVVLSAAPRPT